MARVKKIHFNRGAGWRRRCHKWVEFVGSLLCSRGFSPGTPDFPSQQKPTFDIRCFDLIRLTVSPVSRALVLA